MVSPSRATTSRPSRVKVILLLAVIASPRSHRLAQVIGKIFQHAQERVGRRLAEAADRGVAHGGGKLGQQRRIPTPLLHQLYRLLGAYAAGRALPTTLVFKETHEIDRGCLHVVLLGESNPRMRAEETAVFLHRAD